jgi:hypothetical protein
VRVVAKALDQRFAFLALELRKVAFETGDLLVGVWQGIVSALWMMGTDNPQGPQ